jgi:hypothetical protein
MEKRASPSFSVNCKTWCETAPLIERAMPTEVATTSCDASSCRPQCRGSSQLESREGCSIYHYRASLFIPGVEIHNAAFAHSSVDGSTANLSANSSFRYYDLFFHQFSTQYL